MQNLWIKLLTWLVTSYRPYGSTEFKETQRNYNTRFFNMKLEADSDKRLAELQTHTRMNKTG